MRPRRRARGHYGRTSYKITTAFLRRRLNERATVEWAVRLRPDAVDAREAVLDLINSNDAKIMAEPWRTTWRLIEESWTTPQARNNLVDAQFLRDRLRSGERSGSLVSAITQLVAPWVEITPMTALDSPVHNSRRTPRAPNDLISIGISSGDIIDPSELSIDIMTDLPLLLQIFHSLDAALVQCLDLGERIWGAADALAPWHFGLLYRVYFAATADPGHSAEEPDRHHTGIAPLVKLQFAVAERIKDLSISHAAMIADLWLLRGTPTHVRMWAAFARDARIASADSVATWLLTLGTPAFWDTREYPEVAELRATRFAEFTTPHQSAIVARIRRLPPRSWWIRSIDDSTIAARRTSCAARELHRIQLSGAELPASTNAWLVSALQKFPYLAEMDRVVDGFPEGSTAHWRQSDPDERYDSLITTERLRAIEDALSGQQDSTTVDAAERARDWIRLPSSHVPIICDFESTGDAGAAFALVWDRFGWNHSPAPRAEAVLSPDEAADQCSRVLALISALHDETLRKAIGGISHWLSEWEEYAVNDPAGHGVWRKLWPLAVEATNSGAHPRALVISRSGSQLDGESTEVRLDTLNSPAGKLVGVFLKACPNIRAGDGPLDWAGPLKEMRDMVMSAEGVSQLIVLHRLIECIDYFLRADPSWSRTQLIQPLDGDGHEAAALWSALARRIRSRNVLETFGDRMISRALDHSLNRADRGALVTNLVAECLWAYRDERSPVFAADAIQQMIRKLDDEVRIVAAHVLRDFISVEPSDTVPQPNGQSPASLFRNAVRPFLAEVWPQERSIASPGVSEAFAALPAATRGAFATAVAAIERFLTPFECWSLLQYGLRADNNNSWNEAGVTDEPSATALLTLLDRTIAATEGTVIPHDLTIALAHIRTTASQLARTGAFRRLEAAARKG